MPEWYDISPQDYENRFKQRFKPDAETNILGYGPGKKYVPPLFKPQLAATHIERHWDLIFTGGPVILWMYIVQSIVWDGLLNGETMDMFWYNNSGAAGSQAYPMMIFKYYDFYSLGGFFVYIFDWMWAVFATICSPLTLFIPIDIWLALFNYSWDGIWKIMIPAPTGHFFGIELENGWTMG